MKLKNEKTNTREIVEKSHKSNFHKDFVYVTGYNEKLKPRS